MVVPQYERDGRQATEATQCFLERMQLHLFVGQRAAENATQDEIDRDICERMGWDGRYDAVSTLR